MPRTLICGLLFVSLFWLEPVPENEPETGKPHELHLKTRTFNPKNPDPKSATSKTAAIRHAAPSGRQHLLVQFERELREEDLRLLADAGALILGFVPDLAYVISVPDGFDWERFPLRAQLPIAPSDKWSPMLEASLALGNELAPEPVFYLVLFHEDVPPEDARDLVLNQLLEVREHPDLVRHHLLVQGPEAVIRGLTEYDEVAYILPAAPDLARGTPLSACASGAVGGFPLSPLAAAASTGPGWAANPRSPVTLNTTWGAQSTRVEASAARAEIERALNEWSRVVQVRFSPGTAANAPRNLHFLFGTRSHGDGSPFTGSTGVIAHAFFPAPPNPEPIAGDIHFNDEMPFRIGADIDLFSVALHELGHALGLPHTDAGNAVMYPYYRKVSSLTPTDIANIRRLYLSTEAVAQPALRLKVDPVTGATAAGTNAQTTDLAGTVENGVPPIRIQWSNSRGGSGTVQADSLRRWSARNIPLQSGANVLTLTATDTSVNRVVESVTITRATNMAPAPAPAPAPGPPPAPGPELRITSPANQERTTAATVRITGTAAAAQGLRRIVWNTATASGQAASGQAASGQAEAFAQWTVAALPLERGVNLITVRAEALNGLTATATLSITREAANDTTAPRITILSPNGPSLATPNATVVLSGTASDAGGLSEVTWQNGTRTGRAAGTDSWRVEVPVDPGFNTVIVRARDTFGNSSWRSLSVTRR